ncbi:MAG: alpha-L-fucosidase, partial [Clostridia bacterium]|nr:alpha-L-fucosidase [Clostridia bacterium]
MKVKPTEKQIEWQKDEFGAIIHFDLPVYEQQFQLKRPLDKIPQLSSYKPIKLNVRQWVESIANAGVKYIILVAKHCSGFALFPSSIGDYDVKNTNYPTDIVAEFKKTCKELNIKAGVYYSTGCNGYQSYLAYKNGWDEKTALDKYNMVLETQLKELWSNYGEWYEIWFDGGTRPVEQGGLDIAPILHELQPNAITFQGERVNPQNNTRWVGNERGYAPFDCYSTISGESQSDGVVENKSLAEGDRYGKFWRPAETDVPMWAKNKWFFTDGKNLCYSSDKLLDIYYNSVGHNSNLLLGVVVNRDGLVPEKDVQVLKELGEKIKENFGAPIATTSGIGKQVELIFDSPQTINQIVLKEEISNGHTVHNFEIISIFDGKSKKIASAKVIGNKRVFRIKQTKVDKLILRISDYDDNPII